MLSGRTRGCWLQPPLTRGTRQRGGDKPRVQPSIPAHAGSTHAVCLSAVETPFNPRSRGGTLRAKKISDSTTFNPRSAGNTRDHRRCDGPDAFNPRSRGEHIATLAAVLWPFLKSPLTRGAPSRSRCTSRSTPSIPAHAGNTGRVRTMLRTRSFNPRSRGEHPALRTAAGRRTLQSPLTRGARAPRAVNSPINPSIPAHAGSTSPCAGSRGWNTFNPRSRGEHMKPARLFAVGIETRR